LLKINEKQVIGLAISVTMFVMGYLLVDSGQKEVKVLSTTKSVVQGDTGSGEKIIEPLGFKPGEVCGEVLEKCIARVEVQSDTCDRSAAESQMREQLRDPLDNLHCRDIHDRMNESCFKGCKIDLLALVTIPGGIQIDFDGKRNMRGVCLGEGQRSVTIRGACYAE